MRISQKYVMNNLNNGTLHNRKRKKKIAHACQILMYVLWQNTRMTLAEIGKYLGGRTPATVSWGYQRIAKKLPNDKKLQKIVKRIGEKLEM